MTKIEENIRTSFISEFGLESGLFEITDITNSEAQITDKNNNHYSCKLTKAGIVKKNSWRRDGY